MTWTTTIAIFALLQGVGKFLDEYHIPLKIKDQLQLLLIQAFLFVEKVRIPNIPLVAFRVALRTEGNFSWKLWSRAVGVSAIPVLIIDSFFLVRTINRIGFIPNLDGLESLASPLVFGLLFGIIMSTFVFMPTRMVFAYCDSHGIIMRFLAIPASLMTFAAIYGVLGEILYTHSAWNVWEAVLTTINAGRKTGVIWEITMYLLFSGPIIAKWLYATASIVIVSLICIAIIMALMALTRISIALIRIAAMAFFNAATSPQTSPFTYTTAWLGIAMLILKLLQDVVGSIGTTR